MAKVEVLEWFGVCFCGNIVGFLGWSRWGDKGAW